MSQAEDIRGLFFVCLFFWWSLKPCSLDPAEQEYLPMQVGATCSTGGSAGTQRQAQSCFAGSVTSTVAGMGTALTEPLAWQDRVRKSSTEMHTVATAACKTGVWLQPPRCRAGEIKENERGVWKAVASALCWKTRSVLHHIMLLQALSLGPGRTKPLPAERQLPVLTAVYCASHV